MWASLKKKWNIQSDFQAVLIMTVFSLAGLAIGPSRHLIWKIFGFTPQTPTPVKVITYIACIFPLYQMYLMIFGTLLGQFRFFWNKQKSMAKWILHKVRKA